MAVNDARRGELIARMASHLLGQGLSGASLRPLAAACGTSDRMLLYYFRDKTELLSAVLGAVALDLAARLDAAVPPAPPQEFGALLAALRGVLRGDELAPYMRLWLDIAVASARGEDPYRAVASGIAGGFADWIAARLAAPPGTDAAGQAAHLLALVEGMAVLDAAGMPHLSAAALDAATRPA